MSPRYEQLRLRERAAGLVFGSQRMSILEALQTAEQERIAALPEAELHAEVERLATLWRDRWVNGK